MPISLGISLSRWVTICACEGCPTSSGFAVGELAMVIRRPDKPRAPPKWEEAFEASVHVRRMPPRCETEKRRQCPALTQSGSSNAPLLCDTSQLGSANSDYVEANIGRFDEPIRHILIVSAGNKALAEEIRREQAMYDARTEALQRSEASLANLESERGKVFQPVPKPLARRRAAQRCVATENRMWRGTT